MNGKRTFPKHFFLRMLVKIATALSLGVVAYIFTNRLNRPKVIGVKPASWYDFFTGFSFKEDSIIRAYEDYTKSEINFIYVLFVEMLRLSGKEVLDFVVEQERLGNVENAWPRSTSEILGDKTLSVAAGKAHTKLRKLNAVLSDQPPFIAIFQRLNTLRRICCRLCYNMLAHSIRFVRLLSPQLSFIVYLEWMM
jgi:hypothetical protein